MKTIVLIGPESTGKTWLSGLLAGYYDTSWCPEYLREFYDKYSGVLKDQMELVARRQIAQEKELFELDLPILFLDTNIITIKLYYEHYFKEKAHWFTELYQPQLYSHYLLLSPDGVPWVDDPQRDSPEVQQALYHKFKQELGELSVAYTILDGCYEERLSQAKNAIENL